jgi:3-oxoacyl-[acyl-carrier protein] reductase
MRTVLVTGGSRGIGRAVVEEFSAEDYAVAFTYSTSDESARQLLECLRSRGCTVAAYQADVRDYERAAEVVEATQTELGPIDVLVNNAGIRRDGAFTMLDTASWHEVVNTNLGGTFNYTRALMRELIRRGGCVINIASVSGQIGLPGQTSYSASKAGIIGLTRALAKEVARFGVRVNAIAPGFIETDMTSAIDENVRKKLYSQIPMGKPGSARDVARMALFLAGESAAYATGQVWTVDGGLS